MHLCGFKGELWRRLGGNTFGAKVEGYRWRRYFWGKGKDVRRTLAEGVRDRVKQGKKRTDSLLIGTTSNEAQDDLAGGEYAKKTEKT